jgi:hypothetical protein
MTESLLTRLAKALDGLAAEGRLITYGELALLLQVPAPGSIAQLSAALESLMEADAAAGLPLRAVLCRAKTGNGLPAVGFFEAAARLGRFGGLDAEDYVARERATLFKAAGLG